jgi:hypothetical protein
VLVLELYRYYRSKGLSDDEAKEKVKESPLWKRVRARRDG